MITMEPEAGPTTIAPAAFAAVALILREHDDGLQLLLIQRTVSESDPWSGHVALPGGRQDPTDPCLRYTAEREVLEEVGIDLGAHATYLGRLPDIQARARGRQLNLTIRPFVFHLDQPVSMRLHPGEVAGALWVSLDLLISGQADSQYSHTLTDDVSGSKRTYHLPAYQVEGLIVWGLTYAMLSEFLRRASSS